MPIYHFLFQLKVVIIDAYDIALTPAARIIGRSLFTSPTPITFCGQIINPKFLFYFLMSNNLTFFLLCPQGEVAAYPNPAYAYAYPYPDGK